MMAGGSRIHPAYENQNGKNIKPCLGKLSNNLKIPLLIYSGTGFPSTVKTFVKAINSSLL